MKSPAASEPLEPAPLAAPLAPNLSVPASSIAATVRLDTDSGAKHAAVAAARTAAPVAPLIIGSSASVPGVVLAPSSAAGSANNEKRLVEASTAPEYTPTQAPPAETSRPSASLADPRPKTNSVPVRPVTGAAASQVSNAKAPLPATSLPAVAPPTSAPSVKPNAASVRDRPSTNPAAVSATAAISAPAPKAVPPAGAVPISAASFGAPPVAGNKVEDDVLQSITQRKLAETCQILFLSHSFPPPYRTPWIHKRSWPSPSKTEESSQFLGCRKTKRGLRRGS
jgi:hypothetical protein